MLKINAVLRTGAPRYLNGGPFAAAVVTTGEDRLCANGRQFRVISFPSPEAGSVTITLLPVIEGGSGSAYGAEQ